MEGVRAALGPAAKLFVAVDAPKLQTIVFNELGGRAFITPGVVGRWCSNRRPSSVATPPPPALLAHLEAPAAPERSLGFLGASRPSYQLVASAAYTSAAYTSGEIRGTGRRPDQRVP